MEIKTVSQPYNRAASYPTQATSAPSTAAPIVNAVVIHPLLAHYVFLLRKHRVRNAVVWVNTVGPDIRIYTEAPSHRESALNAVREAEAELVRDVTNGVTLFSPSVPVLFRHSLARQTRAEDRSAFFASESICRVL